MRTDGVTFFETNSNARTDDGVRWRLVRCIALLIAFVGTWTATLPHSAHSQETTIRAQGDDDEAEDSSAGDEFTRRRRRRERLSEDETPSSSQSSGSQQAGVEARIGHEGFKTFGRNDSITHAEVLPYLMVDTHLLFSDLRFFSTNQGFFGGNFGVGYRYLMSDYDRVVGGSLWYDVDESTGSIFHQAGFSLETYGQYLDARANLYVPVSDTEKTFSEAVTRLWFRNNQILYNVHRRIGEAQPGVDIEVGSLLPTDFSRDHALRFYAGYYYFLGDVAPDISGYKLRLEGNFTEWLASQIEMTKDDFYGRNVMLGVSLQFSGGSPRRRTRTGRDTAKLRRFVERNYNIIVPKVISGEYGLVAVNPLTGNPYTVQHVDSAVVGPQNGTVDDPFQSILQAQVPFSDIIFVHAGSVFNNAAVGMLPGQRILGEGVNHTFALAGWGNMPLPRATNGVALPVIQNVAGPGAAVTLADGTEFSGFNINNPGGVGILAPGIGNAAVRNVTVLNAGGDGVFAQNASNNLLFQNVTITNAAGAGFHVLNGDANIGFTGAINNVAGRSLVVNGTTGGAVNLAGATITDNGGTGILIQNAVSDVFIGPTNITTASATGIDIQGGTGDVTFGGTTTVTNTAGIGVRLNNAGGEVLFERLDATSTGGAALFAANSNRLQTNQGSLTATGGAAADITNTELSVELTSVSSNGAATGLRILNSDGRFVVFGTGAAGTGGTIQNAIVGVDVQNAGTVGLQFATLTNNGVGINVVDTDVFQLGSSTVTNSVSYAIDALNTRQLLVTNSTFTGNGAPLDNTIRAQATAAGTYDFRFEGNTFTDNTAGAIAIANSGAANGSILGLSVRGNAITVNRLNADAVGLNWNGPINGSFIGNAITGTGGSNDGFNINATSAANLAQLTFSGNTLNFTGGNDVGMRIATAGPSSIGIRQTFINFNAPGGAGGTGLLFNLAQSAAVDVSSNTITDNVSGGTGILFNSVAGPSTFAINNNLIRLLDPGAGIDRGIIFNAVNIGNGTITLQGNQNNLIQNATTPFFVPLGTSTGRIIINNVPLPP